MIYTGTYHSPLGILTLASNGSDLIGLWFNGQKHFGSVLSEEYQEKEVPPFPETRRWLDIYFRGSNPGFLPPLHLSSTAFRRDVWKLLLTIPYGQTMTYGEAAKKLASQQGVSAISPRAVGNAAGHNPISIIIPCHRIIGAHGKLTGYAGGIERKQALLTLEQSITN